MAGVVIENPSLPEGTRAVVDSDALYEMTLRGWVAVGPVAEGADDGLFTEQEWADEKARREAEVEAALAGTETKPPTKKKG
jgi:hypothetical protein